MEIINQKAKKIMEDCKIKAKMAGMRFNDETLEYIVTNTDLLDLSPKYMIPTLYDYWIHDVGVIRGHRIHEVYPNNPYETVINTRSPISFYNDNNPDWVNAFIFYHVLAHIDYMENNVFFEKTWDYDFCGRALTDKRLIAQLRNRMGENRRWVDYVIEFARSTDNLIGYHEDLNDSQKNKKSFSDRLNFYFDVFLKTVDNNALKKYLEEMGRYGQCVKKMGEKEGEEIFFRKVRENYLEFDELFEKSKQQSQTRVTDILEHIMEYSDFLNRQENKWMKQAMNVVRRTSLFFQPQILTKIFNEGWASYWHEKLFTDDPLINSHEIDFASIDARVTKIPRAGLNPYGLGKQLLTFIESLADQGKLAYEFQKIDDAEIRKTYDKKTNCGKNFLFYLRQYVNDYMLIRFLRPKDFQDFVTKNNLFVVDRRLNIEKWVWEYYVKSRNGEDYRQMIIDSLYHPPYVAVSREKTQGNELYADHIFEGKQLILKYIPDVMRGWVYLWGGPVKLETTIFEMSQQEIMRMYADPDHKTEYRKLRVLYELDDYKKNPSMKYL